MLRRTKHQVATDLPAKQEQVLSISLNAKHDKLYQTRLTRERQSVLGLLDDFDANRFQIFRSLTMLRQLSLHAGLVDEKHTDMDSAKIEFLVEQIPELIAEGHSALIFSQFTGFLRLVERALDDAGVEYSYLDGSMTARRRTAAIKQFTSGASKVFLISLKAGGFGLNLTEAIATLHAKEGPGAVRDRLAAVLQALMEPGETMLGLDLAHGGHLTHGMRLNFSGKLYENAFYGVSKEDFRIDMDEVRKIALDTKPKVICAGWSAYPRTLDFEAFRSPRRAVRSRTAASSCGGSAKRPCAFRGATASTPRAPGT